MNVGQLKKLLDGMNDEMPVVLSGYDHSYNRTYSAYKVVAEDYKGDYYEYHDDTSSHNPEPKLKSVCVVE